jgi:cytochrome P450
MNRIASLGAVKGVFPQWQAKARALVDGLIGQGPFDAIPALAEGFPLAVFPDLIGLRDDGREHLIPYATVAFNAFGPRNDLFLDTQARAVAATEWVHASCRGAAVYAAADRGECTADEAERLVRSFITAGVDTTVNGIATALHAFAEYPDQWLALRENPALLRKAIEESLRWGGTVQTFFRTASRDVAVAGHVIPAGGRVMLFLASANRDPRRWTDPDRFDITRQASGHVGFGFGIHQCLGQMVARYEAEAVLGALLERVAAIRPAGPAQRRLNNTLHAIGSLPIEFITD